MARLTVRGMLTYAVAVITAGSSTALALAFIHPHNFTYLEYLRHPFLRLYFLCLLEAGVAAALLVACLQLMHGIIGFKSLWAWAGCGAFLTLGLVWGLAGLGRTLLGVDFISLNPLLFFAVGGPQFLVQIGALWVSAPVGAVTASVLHLLQRTFSASPVGDTTFR